MLKKDRKKGFTIVELVIVIAVIGILSAVLIPVFSNVVAKANHAKQQYELTEAYSDYAQKVDAGDMLGQDAIYLVKYSEAETPAVVEVWERSELNEGDAWLPVDLEDYAALDPAPSAAPGFSGETFNGYKVYVK